jgi:hypothetical protein
MLIAAKAAGVITHAHKGENLVVPDGNNKTTLADIGISRKLSSEAQKIAPTVHLSPRCNKILAHA